ncbi:MAG: hypothetical protein JRH16_23700, partial [Deltaproteobacteria bacterium]|nr:hypothetical protein [Deltaproteobacteria bacterium]
LDPPEDPVGEPTGGVEPNPGPSTEPNAHADDADPDVVAVADPGVEETNPVPEVVEKEPAKRGTSAVLELAADKDNVLTDAEETDRDPPRRDFEYDRFAGFGSLKEMLSGQPLVDQWLEHDGSDLMGDLDRLRQDIQVGGDADGRVVGSYLSFASSLSIGYTLLLTRGGLLLTSLLSSMPAWRLVDPFPILARLGKTRDHGDEESLSSLVSQGRETEAETGPEEPEADDQEPAADASESRGTAPGEPRNGRNEP